VSTARSGPGGLRRVPVVLAVFAGLALSLLLAAPASAHAVLVNSSPADGSRVDHQPAAVSLTFDEAVQPIAASDEVISASGARVDTGRLSQSRDGATVTLALKPGLPTGTYTAIWRVVSADTHIVSGSVTFGLGENPTAAAAQPVERTGALDVAADVAEGLLYAGLVLLLGIAAATAAWWPGALTARRVRVSARLGWALAFAGTAAALLLQGPRAADGSWAEVARFTDFGQTMGSAFGWELVARAGLLVLLLPLLTRTRLAALRRRNPAVAGIAAGVALLVSTALTGHAAAGSLVPLAVAATVLHLAAMVLWLGGLAALTAVVLPASRTAAPGLVTAAGLRHWSAAAYSCVAVLVVSGEYQASRQLNPVQSLWTTAYGVVLLVKLVLVAVIVAAAALAQRHVRALATADGVSAERFARGDPHAVLRRSVRIEAGVAVLVLAVTALLVSEPPGSTTYGPAVTVTAPLGPNNVAHVHVDSTARGREQFEVTITDRAGFPVPVQSVSASLSSAEVASLALKLTPQAPVGPGRADWRATPVSVPESGPWTVDLDVTIDNSTAYASTTRYQVW
jgi:copper transport protein